MTTTGAAVEVVGIDEVDRLDRLDAVFTDGEHVDVAGRHDPRPGLAARLAAKRAVASASGTTIADLLEVEVRLDRSGRPGVRLHGAAATSLGDCVIHVSLSHEGNTAAAFVVIEELDS